MQDPVLHFLAWCVLGIDMLILVGSLVLAYILIKYRREFTALYHYIQLMYARRASL